MLGSVVVAHHDGAGPLELLFTDASAQVTRRALILLDLNLPKIAGLKVLRRIRAYEWTHIIPSPFSPVLHCKKTSEIAMMAAPINTVCMTWMLLN
jgi:CheY-like chemotaxis protein